MNIPKRAGILNDIRDRSVDFKRGDLVYKINPITVDPINIAGIVTTVFRGMGVIDVEFPWGNEQCSMDEVVRAALNVETIAPAKDTSAPSWGISRSRGQDGTSKGVSAALANTYVTQRGYYLLAQASKYRFHRKNRSEAVVALNRESSFSEKEVLAAVDCAYDTIPKFGLYWHSPGRMYRPNQSEQDSKQYICPRCGTPMVKLRYRKQTKLHGCPKCLFLIDPSDLWTPESEIEQVVVEASVRPNDDMAGVVVDVLDEGIALPGKLDTDLKDTAEQRALEMADRLEDSELRNIDTYRAAVEARALHQAAASLNGDKKYLVGCEVISDDVWGR